MLARFARLEPLLLPLASINLVALCVGPWAYYLSQWAHPRTGGVAPSTFLLACMGMGLVLITAFAIERAWSLERVRITLFVSGFISIGLMLWLTYPTDFPAAYFAGFANWDLFIAPEFLAIFAGVVIWWVAISVGRTPTPHEDLPTTFFGGIVALMLLLLANRFAPKLSLAETNVTLILFFTLGLGALALASFQRARQRQKAATGISIALNRYWSATVGSVIGGVLLVGLILIALTGSPWTTFGLLLAPLKPLADAALGLLSIVMAILGAPILWVIGLIVPKAGEPTATPTPTPGPISTPSTFQEFLDSNSESANAAFAAVNTFNGAVILLVLLVLIWWGIRRFAKPAVENADETRESILTRDLLLAQLKTLLPKRKPRPAPPPPPYLSVVGGLPSQRIRRAYQRLLAWTQKRNLPERLPGQTPHRYGETLAEAAPEHTAALATLTQLYQQARYTTDTLLEDEAQRAEQAVAAIEVSPPNT